MAKKFKRVSRLSKKPSPVKKKVFMLRTVGINLKYKRTK